MDWQETLAWAHRVRQKAGTVEDLLGVLRGSGLDMIDSIKVIREIEGVTLGQAKEIVHLSATWRDRRQINEELHDSVERAVETLRKEGDSVSPGNPDDTILGGQAIPELADELVEAAIERWVEKEEEDGGVPGEGMPEAARP